MPDLEVNGCRLYYEQHGSGPDVIFMYGEDHGLEEFEHQISDLGRDYRCLVYDRRGHGQTASTPYGYSLNSHTLDFAGLLDHLELQKVAIVAVAMSTPIAVSYTLHHPERVRGLALSSWYELAGYPLMEERRRQPGRLSFGALHLTMHEISRDGGADALRAYVEREAEVQFPILPRDPELRERMIDLITSHEPQRFLQACEYYTSLPNLVPLVSQISCPILGICGEDDPSPDSPESLGQVADFTQVWIPGARRFSMVERPAEFNAAVRSFLERLA